MAGTYNFTIDQGSDFSMSCSYTDENDSAINLTGMSLTGYARANKEDTYKKFEFTCTITNAAGGLFTINYSATNSSALDITKLNKYFYDIELNTGSTKVRLMEGIVTINREVTR